MKTFEKLEVPIIGVIENMSGPMFGSGAGELLANTYNVDYLGSVPMEAEVRVGGDTGDPVVVAHPESDAAAALNDIARKVAAKVSLLTLQKQAEGVIPIQMIG
jgi:ATP-binding protein involved in chromosome partitioning